MRCSLYAFQCSIDASTSPKAFITVGEVTALLRCHRVTVLRLIDRGALNPIKVGRALRFDRDEVLAAANCTIAIYPHLRIVSRRKLRQAARSLL
jgi:excisionase family DNA binding protein